MIKFLEDQELKILFGKEISDQEEIMYEVSSEDKSTSDEKYIFMIIDQPDSSSISYLDPFEEKKESFKLGDVIGENFSFVEE